MQINDYCIFTKKLLLVMLAGKYKQFFTAKFHISIDWNCFLISLIELHNAEPFWQLLIIDFNAFES